MKSVYKSTINFFFIIIATGLFSCADSETKLRPIPSGTTTVIINLDLPPEDPTAFDNTIWNRIRRLFVRDAVAQTPPATFSSISVTVTAADIATVQQNFLPTDTMLLNLPAGDARRFDIMATVAPGDLSGARSFTGTATTSLTEGQTVSLPVSMTLSETRLIIPDNRNNRIVKIDSMAGDGWVEKTGPNIGFSVNTFMPYDIDFDTRGRIYIANNNPTTGGNVIIRINNLSDTAAIAFGNGGGSGIAAVAVDRVRNLVYYAAASTLKRCGLNGSGDTTLAITGAGTMSTINGLDVDQSSGDLFIAAAWGVAAAIPSIGRFTISGTTATLIASQALTGGTVTSRDVIILPPSVFVAQSFGSPNNTGNRITQFDMGLTISAASAQFLTQNASASPQQFFGTDRFIAPPNRRLVVIDEDQSGVPSDRLIGFDDITGTNPVAFGTGGAGVGQFHFLFWNGC